MTRVPVACVHLCPLPLGGLCVSLSVADFMGVLVFAYVFFKSDYGYVYGCVSACVWVCLCDHARARVCVVDLMTPVLGISL